MCDKFLKVDNYWQKGSFTVESTIVFPIVFIFLLISIGLSLMQFQISRQFYETILTVDRCVYNWHVVDKQFDTGEYNATARRLSLYWQLSLSNMHHGLLYLNNANETEALVNLLVKKDQLSIDYQGIEHANSLLTESYNTTIKRDGIGLNRINIKTTDKSTYFLSHNMFPQTDIGVSSYSYISEPDEFIRLINLIYHQFRSKT